MAESSSYRMIPSGEKAAPLPKEKMTPLRQCMAHRLPYHYLILTYLLLMMQKNVNQGWLFLVHQRRWPQSVNLCSLFKVLKWKNLSFLSRLEGTWHTNKAPPAWLLFTFWSQKSDGILLYAHQHCLSWEGFNSAYSEGLLHVHFLTSSDDW